MGCQCKCDCGEKIDGVAPLLLRQENMRNLLNGKPEAVLMCKRCKAGQHWKPEFN